jgi:hypothetical protein
LIEERRNDNFIDFWNVLRELNRSHFATSPARGYSVEKYGIEPGPELARMHQRILA